MHTHHPYVRRKFDMSVKGHWPDKHRTGASMHLVFNQHISHHVVDHSAMIDAGVFTKAEFIERYKLKVGRKANTFFEIFRQNKSKPRIPSQRHIVRLAAVRG